MPDAQPQVADVPVLGGAAVLAAVSPAEAIDRTRLAFERYARREWEMPAKVYLEAPPNGDFRAMPARGDGFALLKWVTSFPRNPERGLPVVTGSAAAVERRDRRAAGDHRLRRRSPRFAPARGRPLSAQVLAADRAASVGIIGCGVNGAWAARCLAAAGYGPGRLRRSSERGGRGARGRARLGGGRALRSRRAGRGGHRHAGPRAGDPGRRPAPRPAPGRARGRRRRERPRSSSRRFAAAGCSATSESRRRRAASWRTASPRGSSAPDGADPARRRA